MIRIDIVFLPSIFPNKNQFQLRPRRAAAGIEGVAVIPPVFRAPREWR